MGEREKTAGGRSFFGAGYSKVHTKPSATRLWWWISSPRVLNLLSCVINSCSDTLKRHMIRRRRAFRTPPLQIVSLFAYYDDDDDVRTDKSRPIDGINDKQRPHFIIIPPFPLICHALLRTICRSENCQSLCRPSQSCRVWRFRNDFDVCIINHISRQR